jgi:hypothetical protein
VLLITIIDERVEPLDRFRPDIATAAAIAAVGAAEFDEFLAAKGDRAVAAIAGTDLEIGIL